MVGTPTMDGYRERVQMTHFPVTPKFWCGVFPPFRHVEFLLRACVWKPVKVAEVSFAPTCPDCMAYRSALVRLGCLSLRPIRRLESPRPRTGILKWEEDMNAAEARITARTGIPTPLGRPVWGPDAPTDEELDAYSDAMGWPKMPISVQNGYPHRRK